MHGWLLHWCHGALARQADPCSLSDRHRCGSCRTRRTPIRALRANAVAERVVRTLRQECLDQVIVWNERHLHTVLGEFLRYYNYDRPHRALRLEMPIPQPTMLPEPWYADRSWAGCTMPTRGRLELGSDSSLQQPGPKQQSSAAGWSLGLDRRSSKTG